jgi:hypothetical protein
MQAGRAILQKKIRRLQQMAWINSTRIPQLGDRHDSAGESGKKSGVRGDRKH